jgi:hypothetical protein
VDSGTENGKVLSPFFVRGADEADTLKTCNTIYKVGTVPLLHVLNHLPAKN